MKFDELDSRFRSLEKALDQTVARDQFVVARLDGRGFAKLTSDTLSFEKPFDVRFHDMMKRVCEHLMQTGMNFTLCYTQSDEISLLFARDDNSFGHKIRKLNSVLAGEASGVFSLAVGYPASFDCRLCPLPAARDVADYFCWRAEDAQRNALNAFCYWALRKKGESAKSATNSLDGLSAIAKHRYLHDLNIDFAAQASWMRRGALLSWRDMPHLGENPLTREKTRTTRRRLSWQSDIPANEAFAALILETMK